MAWVKFIGWDDWADFYSPELCAVVLLYKSPAAAPVAPFTGRPKPPPVTKLPTEPRLNTRKLLAAQGKPAGLLFPTEDAFAEADYKVELKEAAELGMANTVAANKIFEILAAPPKKWWQFWR